MSKKMIMMVAFSLVLMMVFAFAAQAATTTVSLSMGDISAYSSTLSSYKSGYMCGRNNAASETILILQLKHQN